MRIKREKHNGGKEIIHVEVTDVCSLKLIFLDHQTALHTSSIPFHD